MTKDGQSENLDHLVSDLASKIQPGEVVLGLGNDIAEVRRIAALIDRPGGSFLTRSFTSAEIDECGGKARPEIHFAGKWAAKEAVYKALKLRWTRPFSWKEIEILSTKGRQDGEGGGHSGGGGYSEGGGGEGSGHGGGYDGGAPQVRLSEKILGQLRADRRQGPEQEPELLRADRKREPEQGRTKGRKPVDPRKEPSPRLLVSISHCDEYAFAVALAVTRDVKPAVTRTFPPAIPQDVGRTGNEKTTYPEVEKAPGP